MDSTKTEEIGDEGRNTGPTQTKDAGQWEERQTDKQRRGGGGEQRTEVVSASKEVFWFTG